MRVCVPCILYMVHLLGCGENRVAFIAVESITLLESDELFAIAFEMPERRQLQNGQDGCWAWPVATQVQVGRPTGPTEKILSEHEGLCRIPK